MCIRDSTEGGVISAVKSFYFLEEHDALGGLERVGTMLDKARYSTSLSSKLTAHLQRINPVSYTHLDVYKRQLPMFPFKAHASIHALHHRIHALKPYPGTFKKCFIVTYTCLLYTSSLRSLYRTHTAVVSVMYISNLESGTVS